MDRESVDKTASAALESPVIHFCRREEDLRSPGVGIPKASVGRKFPERGNWVPVFLGAARGIKARFGSSFDAVKFISRWPGSSLDETFHRHAISAPRFGSFVQRGAQSTLQSCFLACPDV